MYEQHLNPKDLPDIKQVRQVANAMYDVLKDLYHAGELVDIDLWENSSVVTGIRSKRVRFYVADTKPYEPTVARLKAMADTLPLGCYRLLKQHLKICIDVQYDSADSDAVGKYVYENQFMIAFKIFYRSKKGGGLVGPIGRDLHPWNFAHHRNNPLYKDHPLLQDPEFVKKVKKFERRDRKQRRDNKIREARFVEERAKFAELHPHDAGIWDPKQHKLITGEECDLLYPRR